MVTSPARPSGSQFDLALDFVNTLGRSRRGRPDPLASSEGMRAWLLGAGLLDDAGARDGMSSSAFAREVGDEARRLRAALRALFASRSAGTGPTPQDLFALNRLLGRGARTASVELIDGRLELTDVHRGDGPLDLLAPIALAGVRLAATVDPERLRECAADDCVSWFVDTSKGGRRRWCSMARCGNRAKAARHRRRRRGRD